MSKLKIFNECCKNCLMSPDRIVSPARMKDIINGCVKEQSYFVCHKVSMNEETVVCKTFYDRLGHTSQLIRIMERLDGIEFVPQPDAERLPSYKELSKDKQRILNNHKVTD